MEGEGKQREGGRGGRKRREGEEGGRGGREEEEGGRGGRKRREEEEGGRGGRKGEGSKGEETAYSEVCRRRDRSKKGEVHKYIVSANLH